MKVFTCFFAIFFLSALAASSAQLGPDVAILEIYFGKEKQPRRVVLGFYDSAAPVTVANFKELVTKKFYNNMRFHRAFPNSLLQTGDPFSRRGPRDRSGTGGPGYTLPAEIGQPHKKGAIAMSRIADQTNPARVSNGSQYYICLEPMPQLDGQYTVFGEVLEGMDVLESISQVPTDSNDFPLPKIVIKRVTLEPRLASPPTVR